MNNFVSLQLNQLPFITQRDIRENKLRLLEAAKVDQYYILIYVNVCNEIHGAITFENKSFIYDHEKIKPSKYNIGNIKKALKILSVDWVIKYKKVYFECSEESKVYLYLKYADYYIKRYKHCTRTDLFISSYSGLLGFMVCSV